MSRPLIEDLTPQQAEAVTHAGGPLLVLAGAGAGKTRVLCNRLAWLVNEGADPGEILALTFSAKAAAELRERAEAMIPGSHETLRVTTFHSYALDLVRTLGTDRDLAPVLQPAGMGDGLGLLGCDGLDQRTTHAKPRAGRTPVSGT